MQQLVLTLPIAPKMQCSEYPRAGIVNHGDLEGEGIKWIVDLSEPIDRGRYAYSGGWW